MTDGAVNQSPGMNEREGSVTAKLKWWLDYIAYELRDPYDVVGNHEWATGLDNRAKEIWP